MIALALFVIATPTGHVSGEVTMTAADGTKTNPDRVVVYVTGFTDTAPEQHAQMHQRDRRFVPNLLAVAQGQTVDFANDDVIWHNVFSVSKARSFDLGMTKKPETKSVTFGKTGVIDVYCNIHPSMVGTIIVLPNHAYAIVDSNGHYNIDDIPPGDYKVFAWSRTSEVKQAPLRIEAGKTATLDFALAQTQVVPDHKDKYGRDYRPEGKY